MKLGEIMGRTPGDYMGTILMRTIELEHGDIFVASSYVWLTVRHGLLMAYRFIDGLANLKTVDLSMAMLNNQMVDGI